jgi:hypothetical protein
VRKWLKNRKNSITRIFISHRPFHSPKPPHPCPSFADPTSPWQQSSPAGTVCRHGRAVGTRECCSRCHGRLAVLLELFAIPSNTQSAVVPIPTNAQASQPTLTITIPVASDNIPQLAPQAVAPTNSVEVQAKGGQVTQGQDRTHHGGEEETFVTTFIVPDHQHGT